MKTLIIGLNTIRNQSRIHMKYLGRYSSTCQSVVFSQFGEPSTVLKVTDIEVSSLKPKDSQVLIQILAAPINPADINTIRGVYAIKPKLPAIGGNEAVGRVLQVGSNVTKVRPGDLIIPSEATLGTWRTHAVWEENQVIKIPKNVPLISAATIAVNPCTAYRMLKDFVTLAKGDTVIQNGSNSAVGQAVIQLAKLWGINTINVVRSRENIEELKSFLTDLGANYVVTEEELRTRSADDLIFKSIPKPRLALNCVGGKSSSELMRVLEYRGTHVTYGGMSLQPVIVSTGQLIFKNINVHGYWMTNWNKENGESKERYDMLEYLCSLAAENKFQPPPHKTLPFKDVKQAIEESTKPFSGVKQILASQ